MAHPFILNFVYLDNQNIGSVMNVTPLFIVSTVTPADVIAYLKLPANSTICYATEIPLRLNQPFHEQPDILTNKVVYVKTPRAG